MANKKRLYHKFNVYTIRRENAYTVIATSAQEALDIIRYQEGPDEFTASVRARGKDMRPREMRRAYDEADFTLQDRNPDERPAPKYDDFDLISDLEGKYTEV